MTIKKTFSLKTTTAIVCLAIILTSGLWYALGATPTTTQYLSGGINVGAPSYTFWREGANYFGKDAWGQIDYSGTNGRQVIQSCFNVIQTSGGHIYFKAGIYEIDASLTVILQEAVNTPVPFALSGEGENTVFRFSGSGYALNVTTIYATYEWVKLSNFKIDGITKTAGRNGLTVNVGRTLVVEQVKINNVDIGLFLGEKVNSASFHDVRVVTVNQGIRTKDGNTNELYFYNCQVVNSAEIAWNIKGGSQIEIIGGASCPISGYGMIVNGTWLGFNLYGMRFEAMTGANINSDMLITSTYLGAQGVNIENCYFTAQNRANYSIICTTHLCEVLIKGCTSRGHNIAFIGVGNWGVDLLLLYNNMEDPFYIDAFESLTTFSSRFLGTLIEADKQGLIVVSTDNVTEGDVIVKDTNMMIWGDTTTANEQFPVVVIYDSVNANKPCIIATSGIVPLNIVSSASVKDIMVTSTSSLKADVNNAQTDPNRIIGFIVSTSPLEVMIRG